MEEKVQKREREGDILKAAKKVFAEKGYYEASIDDIIREADIARGTFYLYYTGKRAIFDAILNLTLEEVDRHIRAISLDPGEASPVDQVKANVRRVFQLLIEDRHLADLLFVRAVGIDPEALETLNGFYKKIADLISRAVEQGITIGLLNKCDPQIAAYSILGSVKEVLLRIVLADTPATENIDAVIDEIIRINLYGFYTRGGFSFRISE
jgi:AcrR family transcriptional regulator